MPSDADVYRVSGFQGAGRPWVAALGVLAPGNRWPQVAPPMAMTVRGRIGLVACAWVLGACSTEGSDSEAGLDCQMPFEFSARTYTLVSGPEVGTVEPGRRLGTGQFAPCHDGGGSGGNSRAVHALPDVPTVRAVVLLGEGDRGAVYVSADPASTERDVDLLALLDAWSVDPPRP